MLVLQWCSVSTLAQDTLCRKSACWCTVRLFSPQHFVMMYRQRASCGLPNLKMSQEKERAQKCWKKDPFCAQGTASNTGNEHKFAVSCPASESAVPWAGSLPPLPPPHFTNPELKTQYSSFEKCVFPLFFHVLSKLCKSNLNGKRLYFNKCELSEFAYQIKPNEFWTCFKFQARGPNSLHFAWQRARFSNKVLSRRQEILEKSNNVMTMFITFTVRPACTSAQHQTLVRPERKPFLSWQRFAPARCYHFTGIFSPNKQKIHITYYIFTFLRRKSVEG